MTITRFILCLSIFLFSCNQVDTSMQTELNNLKEKLAKSEMALADATAQKATFIHTVYFWMKEDVTDAQKADFFKNGCGALAKCPTIQNVFYGPPAMTPREVVDNSYDVAWICHFATPEDQEAYQKEPIHLKFIEDYSHLWERVQVYDNLIAMDK